MAKPPASLDGREGTFSGRPISCMRLLAAMTIALAIDAVAATTRGTMAFHYATPLTPSELAWYGRFEMLVTHDPLPRAQVEALRAKGTKLLLYEWSVAFYPSIATPWQKGLPASALLNSRHLHGHLGAQDAGAFYYDPASREHTNDRARALAAKLASVGYDGVFFDTTTRESVHPDALAEYERRHPDVPYDVAFARFLRRLRREVKVIATNQGYRAAEHVLPFADVDVSESLITRPVGGRFVMRPWYDPRDEWNSISFLMRKLIAPAQRAYPKVRFVHLNYLDTLDAASVARIVAIARLYDADAFVTNGSHRAAGGSEAYFEDLGKPTKPRVETKKHAYRFFEKGLIAVNFGREPLTIANRARSSYVDTITGERTRARHLLVAPGAFAIFRRH